MKKLFSLVMMLFLGMVLLACDEGENEEISRLEALLAESNQRVTELEESLSTKESELSDVEEDITSLQAMIDDLLLQIVDLSDVDIDALNEIIAELEDDLEKEALLNAHHLTLINNLRDELERLEPYAMNDYDGFIFITVKLDEDTSITRAVPYYEDAEASLFDLLEVTFHVDYIDTQWGKQILGIETLTAPFGSFIAFYMNDDFASTGVESTPYEHLDHFAFERSWWNEEARVVYESISLFLAHQEDDFIDREDYLVLTALAHLNQLEDVSITLDETLPESVSGLIQRIFTEEALMLDSSDTTEALYAIKSVGHLYTTALVYAALKTNDSLDLTSFEADLLVALNQQNLENTDLDTLAMMLVALSYFEDVELRVEEVVSAIETELYESTFGDNAATFASVVLGLVSVGENPFSDRFENDEEESLVSVLLSFQNADGSFNWTTEQDLMFSTPQAFIALVALSRYVETSEAFNPFTFE